MRSRRALLVRVGQLAVRTGNSVPPAARRSIDHHSGVAPKRACRHRSAVSVSPARARQRQIRFVSDALRAVPGVAVNRQGPAGTVTQVRIRGAEANHTVVLIDGVKINDPFTSEVDFAHLLTAQIDRIEILRGPQSVLYGSEAIGGVISIFTKRGSPGVQIDASAEGGSFSTYDGAAACVSDRNMNYALSATTSLRYGTNFRASAPKTMATHRTLYARAGGASYRRIARRVGALSRQPRRVDPQTSVSSGPTLD